MRAEVRSALLLVLGTLALCEDTFEKVVQREICTLKCADDMFPNECQKNCTGTPQGIEVLENEEARANATLLCRDVAFVVLAHNPGIFVIERRLDGDTTWRNPMPSHGPVILLRRLKSGSPYEYRLHRILVNGVSKPEIMEPIKSLQPTYTNLREVRNISLSPYEVEPEDPHRLRTEITFTPTEDRSCYYEVVLRNSINLNIERRIYASEGLNATIEDLEFNASYWIEMTANTLWDMRSSKTYKTFATPTCAEFHKNLTLCAPPAVTGLNATSTRRVGHIFVVNVTWDTPDLIPDFYELRLGTGDLDIREPVAVRNVSGTSTEFVFPEAEIKGQYYVCISAFSAGGAGEAIYKIFEILEEPIDFTGPIIMASLASVVLAVGAGVYAYHMRRKPKPDGVKPKYIDSLGEKDGPLELMKDEESQPELIIVGKKSLLIPVDKYEISPDRLVIKRVLGTGAFGVVKLGSLRDYRGQVTPVAIKMLRDYPNEEDVRSFEREIELMKSTGHHPNIVSFLGCCTVGARRRLLVVEYCSRGDLQSFLRKAIISTPVKCVSSPRFNGCITSLQDNAGESLSVTSNSGNNVHVSNFVANCAYAIDQESSNDTGMVTVANLLNFGRQIATGMEFLASNRIVHRDLAARNVLVCDDRTVKISDFGLSRDIYQENVYRKQGNGRLPVKWLAIEALTHQSYETSSDVWSFGILLWEIITLGGNPYPGIPAIDILKWLQSGYRMERPEHCSLSLYNAMLSCWQTNPKDRPTFTTLRLELDRLISVEAPDNDYLVLNDDSEGMLTENQDFQIPTSRSKFSSQHPKYVNDPELWSIHEDQ